MQSKPIEVIEIESRELDYKAWVCLHTESDGMAFGGCRFDLSVKREDVVHLAECMTWKLAAHGLPVGGAKGGLRVDPHNPRFPEILKHFAAHAKPLLGRSVILGKDLGATNETMDAIYSHLGIPQMHVAKSKPNGAKMPDKLRDLTGYQHHMTGLGVAMATRTALEGKVKGKRVLIQGAGAVGAGAAFRFNELGAQIVGISDARGSYYSPAGFGLQNILEACKGGVINAPALGQFIERMDRDQLFAQPADILVLAATSNCVNAALAAKIQASVVSEGANFPLLPEARELLFKRNVLVVPDVLSNSTSGGMVAHQMRSRNSLAHDELWAKIEAGIVDAVTQSARAAKAMNVDLREAYLNEIVPKLLRQAA